MIESQGNERATNASHRDELLLGLVQPAAMQPRRDPEGQRGPGLRHRRPMPLVHLADYYTHAHIKLICTAALWINPLVAPRSFFVCARKLAQKHTSIPAVGIFKLAQVLSQQSRRKPRTSFAGPLELRCVFVLVF